MKKLLIFGSFALIAALVIIVLKPNKNTSHHVQIRYAQTQMNRAIIPHGSSFETRPLTASIATSHSTYHSPTLNTSKSHSRHYNLLTMQTQAKSNSISLGQSNQNTSYSNHQVMGNTRAQNITFQPVSSTQSSPKAYTPFQEPMMSAPHRVPDKPGFDPNAAPMNKEVLILGLIAGAWILKKRFF